MRLWPASGREHLSAPSRLRTRIARHPGIVRLAAARPELARRARSARPRSRLVAVGVAAVVAAAVTGVTVAVVTAGSGTAASAAGASRSPAGQAAAGAAATAPGGAVRVAGRTVARAAGRGQAQRKGSPARAAAARTAAPRKRTSRPVAARPLRTSCRSVAHIGDSTSADLVSPDYLPDPAQRLGARYADVGVRHALIDASGGRSIVEALPGQVNGYDVARAWYGSGYRGCWVFALGTNDTANVAVGSAVGLAARIDRMMAAAHGEPVMWVNTRTEVAGGYWSEANEHIWDDDLQHALARYPNMRIFDWSSVAQRGWFLADGIHYTSPGCAARAAAIAGALARAFPAGGHSASRVVR